VEKRELGMGLGVSVQMEGGGLRARTGVCPRNGIGTSKTGHLRKGCCPQRSTLECAVCPPLISSVGLEFLEHYLIFPKLLPIIINSYRTFFPSNMYTLSHSSIRSASTQQMIPSR
jgi:hypothetical protein